MIKIRWSLDCLVFLVGISIPRKTVLILKHAPAYVCEASLFIFLFKSLHLERLSWYWNKPQSVCEASLCIFLFKLLHIERLLDIETCPSLCLWGFLVYLPIQIITPRKTALILKHAPACVCEASLFTFLCKLLLLERLSWYWDVTLPVSVGLPCLSSYSNYYTKKDCLCIETCPSLHLWGFLVYLPMQIITPRKTVLILKHAPVCVCEASLFIFLCKLLHPERLSWYWNVPQPVSVRLPCLSSYLNDYT